MDVGEGMSAKHDTILSQHREIARRVLQIKERLRELIYGVQPERRVSGDKPSIGNILEEIMAQQRETISNLNFSEQFITDEIAGKIR